MRKDISFHHRNKPKINFNIKTAIIEMYLSEKYSNIPVTNKSIRGLPH
jgi:hypothetical protein